MYRISSETGAKFDSDGSKRIVGSIRQVEVDSRFGHREEENEDDQVLVESRMERDYHFVSERADYTYIYTFFFFEFNEIPQSVLNIYTTIFESPKSLDTLFFLSYIVTKL